MGMFPGQGLLAEGLLGALRVRGWSYGLTRSTGCLMKIRLGDDKEAHATRYEVCDYAGSRSTSVVSR